VELPLSAYDEAVGSVEIGTLWAMSKDGESLRLCIHTDPRGWRLCLCLNRHVIRTDTITRKARIYTLMARWRQNSERQGWTLVHAVTVR
jgi:hypothetical protein